MSAPFGCRAATITARESHGAYVVIAVQDPTAPAPDRSVLHAQRGQAVGRGAEERPFLPRAFSVLRIRGRELQFLIEDVGPGTKRLCELGPGDDLLLLGPLGVGFAPPREDPERCSSVAALGSPRWRSARIRCNRRAGAVAVAARVPEPRCSVSRAVDGARSRPTMAASAITGG